MILADTNILLRSIHTEGPQFAVAESALTSLRLRNEILCVAPQNLVEFWSVATRPRSDNGLGMTHQRGAEELAALRRFFRLLPYTPEVPDTWEQIVTTERISGKQAHDAHLVAVMRANSVKVILTFNGRHSARYRDIRVLGPGEAAG